MVAMEVVWCDVIFGPIEERQDLAKGRICLSVASGRVMTALLFLLYW